MVTLRGAPEVGFVLALVGCGSPSESSPASLATFPLARWSVVQGFGVWNASWDGYHLAEDAVAGPGDSVFAVASGVVRAVFLGAEIRGYGGLLLIEHAFDDGVVVGLYGHISTRRGTPIRVGDRVEPGQLVAFIADDDEDGGGWGPHLHFGIRSGAVDLDATLCGVWLYVGYTRACADLSHEQHRERWRNPSDFLLAHAAEHPGPALGAAGSRRQVR